MSFPTCRYDTVPQTVGGARHQVRSSAADLRPTSKDRPPAPSDDRAIGRSPRRSPPSRARSRRSAPTRASVASSTSATSKNGSSRCDTSYFEARLADFQRFEDPLVYTPGDNEWTDCHRANNGGYLPTERLDTIRRLFFAEPGETLGQDPAEVRFQSRAFPENVSWRTSGVHFGTVHVVGSNDDQAPWYGDRKDATGAPLPETTAETALRGREYTAREGAALAWIDRIFDEAEERGAPAVVIGMQADMWDGPTAEQSAFIAIKAVLADRAARFAKPVLLLEGDSHELTIDTPPGQPANLTRIVVQGSTSVPHEWVRLKVDPATPTVFSCEIVVFGSGAISPCAAPLAP